MSDVDELKLLKSKLDSLGIGYRDEYGTLEFCANDRACIVFNSTRDDKKLYVRYVQAAYVDTAADVLRVCGVIE